MKTLEVNDEDFDCCGDWLQLSAADKFITGEYTHVSCEGEVIECEVISFDDGTKGVALGEQI